MSTPHFHELFVKQITPQAAGAVAVTLAIPPELRDAYTFQPGQFLTLRASIQGEAVRRSYSICSSTQRLDHVLAVRIADIVRDARSVKAECQQQKSGSSICASCGTVEVPVQHASNILVDIAGYCRTAHTDGRGEGALGPPISPASQLQGADQGFFRARLRARSRV